MMRVAEMREGMMWAEWERVATFANDGAVMSCI